MGGHANIRPPLANQLFDDRPEFIRAMDRFPRCKPVIPRLHFRKSGVSVEQVLQSLQAEASEDPERYKQLAAIRYYLKFMLWECEEGWTRNRTHGITNQLTLLDQIRHSRRAEEQVCLVTFNYDTMLEAALSTAGILQIQDLPDYIASDNYKLIKLHGSINWAREVDTPIENIAGMSDEQVANTLIDRADEIKISQRYRMVEMIPQYSISKPGDIALFPALAIPVETKIDFECPTEHLDALRALIPQVDKLLMIGWRATEQPFLQLLADNLQQEVQGLVVAGSKEGAQVTIKNVKQAGVRGEYAAAEGGFTDFVLYGKADEFLRR